MNSSFRKACGSLWLSGPIVCLTKHNYNRQTHDTKHGNFGKKKKWMNSMHAGASRCPFSRLQTTLLCQCRKGGSWIRPWLFFSSCIPNNSSCQSAYWLMPCLNVFLGLWIPALIRWRIIREHIELLKRMFHFLLIQSFICTLTIYMVC